MEVIIEGVSTWQVITLEMFGFGVVESREPKGDPPSAMLLCKRKLFSRMLKNTVARIDGTIITN